MTTTTYTLTCLSPVHIGTGSQMSKFDGAFADQKWHVIDLDAVLARDVDANELARAMSVRNFDWATWLHQKHIAPSDVALYALPCSQDPEAVPIREAMKNHLHQSYLPGTSIKGAVRTAILWFLLQQDKKLLLHMEDYIALRLHSLELLQTLDQMEGGNRKFSDPQAHERAIARLFGDKRAKALCRVLHHALDKSLEKLRRSDFERFADWDRRRKNVNPNPRSVDDPIERAVLGRNPNHDLMRAVQVADSAPITRDHLAIGLVWTYTLRGNRLVEKRESNGDYKAFVEWLRPDTSVQVAIRLDDFLFTDIANRDLHFRDEQEQTVRHLARTCNAYVNALITSEKNFYETYGLEPLRDFCTELQGTLHALPEGAFLLNIGWGSGWEAKTLGDLLRTMLGTEDFKQLRQRYRLGMAPRTRQIYLEAPFPKTRRLAYAGGAPQWPMGWVKLTPQEA
jgi:CRISPR type III-A-associated RAMP protein Csm5